MTEQATGWSGRSVFLTGHTGFKGGWLSLWLGQLGAEVHGYALDPPTSPCFFDVAGVASSLVSDLRADLADGAKLAAAMEQAQPEVVLHLAAQPLVRESYRDPLATFETNVMGTARVLEAARELDSVRAIVVITTDKVYENRGWAYPYREPDPLGGHDPYSASKAAAEIVTASYRSSFFGANASRSVQVATARAGNVIGGGDWAADRLLPDCLRAFAAGETVLLRRPGAVRPWQHVLEPLSGYLRLAERLLSAPDDRFSRAWNFGPPTDERVPVGALAQQAAQAWGADARLECAAVEEGPHEAGELRLDSSLANQQLGWSPRWSLARAVEETVGWHRAWTSGEDMAAFSRRQIRAYEDDT